MLWVCNFVSGRIFWGDGSKIAKKGILNDIVLVSTEDSSISDLIEKICKRGRRIIMRNIRKYVSVIITVFFTGVCYKHWYI